MLSHGVDDVDAAPPPVEADRPQERDLDITRIVTSRRIAVVCLVLVGLRIAAVDLAGIVTNDSLGYLRRADDPFGAGLVTQGYRQVAYPLLISASNLASDVLGWDHIFGVALVQRSLLVLAVATLVWALRWWSAPIVVVATSSSFVVHTDLLLPEGTLVPACLLLGGLLATVATRPMGSERTSRIVLVAAAVLVVVSASIKLQYAALVFLPVAIAWIVYRNRRVTRGFAVTTVGAAASIIMLLATAQAFENRSELGVFEPVSERARAEWYGAWQAVFGLDDDNVSDPDLAEYYDNGNLYTFLHGIEQEEPDYPTRARIIRERVDAMFEAADTSARSEQVAAFVGALRAGRLDDLEAILDRVLDADDGEALLRVAFNSEFAADDGAEIIDDLNDGEAPGIVTTGPLVDFSQRVVPDHRPYRSTLAVVSLVAMLGALFVSGRHRIPLLAVLASIGAIALALSTGYIDNARYLLGPLAVVLVGGTVALRALVAYLRTAIESRA